jgi:hypothetical protein
MAPLTTFFQAALGRATSVDVFPNRGRVHLLVQDTLPAARRVLDRRLRSPALQAASSESRCVVATGSGKGVGLSLGGALVIAGILIWILWSFWVGLIVALVGLIAFGGFVRGHWY